MDAGRGRHRSVAWDRTRDYERGAGSGPGPGSGAWAGAGAGAGAGGGAGVGPGPGAGAGGWVHSGVREVEAQREAKFAVGLPLIWVALNLSIVLVYAAHVMVRGAISHSALRTDLKAESSRQPWLLQGVELSGYPSALDARGLDSRRPLLRDVYRRAGAALEAIDLPKTLDPKAAGAKGGSHRGHEGHPWGDGSGGEGDGQAKPKGVLKEKGRGEAEGEQEQEQWTPGGPRIQGSKIKAPHAVLSFRARWRCLSSISTSHWRLDRRPRLLPWPQNPHKLCSGRKGYLGYASNELVKQRKYTSSKWPVAESLKYVWEPKGPEVCGRHHAPSFVSFNNDEFCSTMRKRGGSLFIVGDSISHHFFLSLKDQLCGGDLPCANPPPSGACASLIAAMASTGASLEHRAPCESFVACGSSLEAGGVAVHSVVSMFLMKVHKEDAMQSKLFKGIDDLPELAWGEEMVRQKASVVLLNRGAHFIGDKPYADQLNYTLHEFRKLLPRTLLVYRSTAAGHPNCTLYEAPIEEPLNLTTWPFNWGDFVHQNEIARALVEGVDGAFLDVGPMSSLRPDWHIGGPDCLHYCQPGPVNDWVKMFAKMLQDLT